MSEMQEVTRELLGVVEACRGGVDTPLSIEVFITLTQKLELLFRNFINIKTNEEANNYEQHLLEAIQLCISCYLKHFDFDVLQYFIVAEPQASHIDDIVHPAMQALERLLATACDHAKSFESETLKEQIYRDVTATFGFIPTLDYTQLSSTCAVSGDFLSFSPSFVSTDETSLQPGLPSRSSSSSTDSDEIITPMEALGCAYFFPSSKISDAPLPASPSSSRSLAEGMDVTDIISCGLGLSDGHRDQHPRINTDVTACSLPHAGRAQTAGIMEAGLGQTFSSESTSERKVPPESKRPKEFTTKKCVSGKRKTASPCSSPDKENIQ